MVVMSSKKRFGDLEKDLKERKQVITVTVAQSHREDKFVANVYVASKNRSLCGLVYVSGLLSDKHVVFTDAERKQFGEREAANDGCVERE